MPYVSNKQRRYMHWAVKHGKIKPSVVKEFDKKSKGLELPEIIKTASFTSELRIIMMK